MPDSTHDGIQLRNNPDTPTPNDWPRDRPRLSCRNSNQLSLEGSDLKLDANKGILFQGNGQISAVGDLSFLTGAPSLVEQLRIFANGNIGIGTGTRQPTDKLEVVGTVKATSFIGEISGLTEKVSKTGDTMTGSLTIEKDLTVIGNLKLADLTVSKFSIDGTLDGNSDLTIPTEKAVKTYVDNKVGGIRSSQWSESGGNLVYNVINSNVGIGTSQPSAKLEVVGSLKLQAGVAVNQFSNDVTLKGNSDLSVPTEKAVKTYIDSKLTGGSSQWSDDSDGSISYRNGNVGIGTQTTPKSLLEIRKDVSGKLGPVLTLQNGSGSAGAGAAIDFNGYDVGQNDPSARIQSLDDNFSSHIAFYTKQPGAATNKLQERFRIQSNGDLSINGNVNITSQGATLNVDTITVRYLKIQGPQGQILTICHDTVNWMFKTEPNSSGKTMILHGGDSGEEPCWFTYPEQV